MKTFLKRHWRKITLAAISLPVVGFFAICLIIGSSVRGAVSNAQAMFPGEPVTALISIATCEERGSTERNRAVWALGQLGSADALPALQSLVTGQKCDHDSLICQYELEKAIEACSGNVNIGAFVWRHGDLAVAR